MAEENEWPIIVAQDRDAVVAAWLMYLAFDDLAQYLFGTKDLLKIEHYFRELWINDENRMSSRLSYVIKHEDKPIALLSCCDGILTSKLFLHSFLLFIKIDPGLILYILRHPSFLYSMIVTPEANKDEFYIFVLAVLPEYQNKGIGTRLIEFAIQKAKERNFKKVSLLVSAKNINAIKFYEKNGFKKVDYFNKKPYNNYKMIKEIG